MRASILFSLVSWLIASGLVVLGVSCSDSSSSKDDVEYFQDNLQSDMSYADLVAAFGEPTVDLNAASADHDGLHIYQYALVDSTFVRIGYTDKIVYACLVDDRSNLIEDIIVKGGNGD